MIKNFLGSEKIIRLTPINNDSKKIADNIVSGLFQIFPTLPSVNIDTINDLWAFEFNNSKSTYHLYSYALYPVSYLLNAYETEENDNYLKQAMFITQSFIKWLPRADIEIGKKRLNILWGDHAVSNRTQTLCYLVIALNTEQHEIPEDVKILLVANGNYLADDKNYSHYNHGLMIDLALLGLINVFDGLEWTYPAVWRKELSRRLYITLERDLTHDGVHVENSPGYHFWILSFYNKIIDSLANYDRTLYSLAKTQLIKATDYARYITRPDGSIPTIGDTHPKLRYNSVSGLSTKFFDGANIVIFREPENKVWAYLGAGYKTHVHKHEDDGSFNLFYQGTDIFFDPGFLSYENDEYSKEIKMAHFHNVARPIGNSLDIKKVDIKQDLDDIDYTDNLSSSCIINVSHTDEYDAALTKTVDYLDGDVLRLVVFFKIGYFVLYDILESSNTAKGFEQIFNINQRLYTEKSSNTTVNILNSNNEVLCKIEQVKIGSELPVSRTQMKFHATGFNKYQENKQISYETRSNEFLTLITLSSFSRDYESIATIDDNILTIEKLSIKNDTRQFSIKRILSSLLYD